MGQQATHAQTAFTGYLARAQKRLEVEATKALFTRRLDVRTALPLISFTFDDFPRTAFLEAGSILRRYGVLGTYYASLGLMGKPTPLGPMYQAEDLKELIHLVTSSDATRLGTAILGTLHLTFTREPSSKIRGTHCGSAGSVFPNLRLPPQCPQACC